MSVLESLAKTWRPSPDRTDLETIWQTPARFVRLVGHAGQSTPRGQSRIRYVALLGQSLRQPLHGLLHVAQSVGVALDVAHARRWQGQSFRVFIEAQEE